ncbi:MFS transporter [Alteribacillus sp. YIM 98480]|uniref:MFS transporter n=1 Tax=Alteribacillus sp. YIM 98480 TaxID=2606599 RepID=UPI00131C5D2B|nr:MFS transporter [Alteribacillus sp. YIM 98480]
MRGIQPLVENSTDEKRIEKEGFVYFALCFNFIVTVMNTSMFNIAIPDISNDFSLTPFAASWIVTSYSVVFAIGSICYGRLSDRFSIRSLLTFGLILFGVGSLSGAAASNFFILVLARLIQAAGASCIPGLGMVLTTIYIPSCRRGLAMGKLNAAAILGMGFGPLLGGLVTYYLGWSALFLMTASAAVMIPVYVKYLPIEKNSDTSFDIVGLLLFSAGLISLLLIVISGSWFFAFGAVCWLFFRLHIRKVKKSPFIPENLITDKRYILSVLLGFLVFFINFSVMFIVPLMMANLFESSAQEIGLIIFPGAIGSALAALFIARLLDRFGVAIILRISMLFLCLSCLLFSSFGYHSSLSVLLFYMISMLSFSSANTGIPKYLSMYLKENQVGVGMGGFQLMQFFGGAFGATVTGKLLNTLSERENALLLFWRGEGVQYSDTFLILTLLSFVAFIIHYFLQKTITQE